MRPWAAWWDGLPHQARFRFYTRASLHLSMVAVAVSIAVTGWSNNPSLLLLGGVAVTTVAAAFALEAQPLLATYDRPTLSRRSLRIAGATQLAVWLWAAVLSTTADADSVVTAGHIVMVLVALMIPPSVLALAPWPWVSTALLAAGTGLVIGDTPRAQLFTAALLVFLGFFLLGTMRLTLWALDQMAEMAKTKDMAAKLEIAEQRLKFSRDLHDVVGRGFSAIAVKSELASTLARAGAADRAADEIDEVKALAVSSMEEMRMLVRGYRVPELASEIVGAQSLLSAAGCRLEVEGAPSALDPTLHEVAAWVVREGTTNIVKHSRATRATLTVGATAMTLLNDGVTEPPGRRSGLGGLQERLADVGATMRTGHDPEASTFTLQIRWEQT